MLDLFIILSLVSPAPKQPPTPPKPVCEEMHKQPLDDQGKPIWTYLITEDCKVINLDNFPASEAKEIFTTENNAN